MKRNILLALVVLLAVLAVAGYALPSLPGTSVAAAPQLPAVSLPRGVAAAPQAATLQDLETAFGNIYTQVNPSVVAIDVVMGTTGSSGQTTPTIPGLPQGHPNVPGGQQALGSGFVWDDQGHVVTNNHVIDGADQISVTFSDGTVASAKVVGADVNSDLAVLKVDLPANQLHPVQMADSSQVKVGQMAIAIGNPFGEQNTMTTGIISAIGRSLPVDNTGTTQTQGTSIGPSYTIPDVIQTDAPINPGNSGGVLLNAAGQVVGVTSAIESPVRASSGVGFAIPAAIVQKVIPSLIKTGKYQTPYLGISGTSMTPSLAQAMNLKADQRGALVASVTPNGPAAKAGLKGSTNQTTINGLQTQVGGDVIVAMNGQAVKSFDDLVAFLARSTQVGQTVDVTILRDGKEQAVKLTLEARPGQ